MIDKIFYYQNILLQYFPKYCIAVHAMTDTASTLCKSSDYFSVTFFSPTKYFTITFFFIQHCIIVDDMIDTAGTLCKSSD